MARSSWKFNYSHSYIFKNIFYSKFKQIKIIKLFCRSSSIPKIFLKKSVALYKGSLFAKIFFTKYSVGFKSGEFAITKKPFNYPTKNKKIKR